MPLDAPTDTAAFLASRPRFAFRANLFTFALTSGLTLRYTDWRRPIVVAGNTYSPTPRIVRGNIRVERGTSVSTQDLELQEANGSTVGLVAQGFFRRAIFTHQRIFAADSTLQWTSPIVRFFGRVNESNVTASGAKFTVKSMLDDLDRDYPFDVIEADCNAVVFDVRCGVNPAAYTFTGAAGAGSTKNKLITGLSNADDYFTQGVLSFTSGAMSGAHYLVKSYAGGVIVPSPPFLAAPATGDAFSVSAGCDKTQATCTSKFGYDSSSGTAPFFRGKPYVPDPTVTY
ncbi:phage conserved hypothetical protein BR0599 [Bryocella elongata]|uniref:Bacteriophage phiJL001 Gp84 C-terminal domain-containing protein n=1 Tax=Bryocella elongata TaxID=863522 RepID=A0A1H6B770_9BACT|nr:DUF2163 domain-containing protein [Bryocella elongata]SEG56470.1 phage conserved hypothetical protein BR0599 [Bryocella elongata]